MDIKPSTMQRAFIKRAVLCALFYAVFPIHVFAANKAQVWIVSWAASQQIPESQNALPAEDLRDATVRQIFHLSAGGSTLRVHLSNAFGSEALHLTAVHIARPLGPASESIDTASDKALTFSGSSDVSIPPGAEYVSDSINYSVAALSDLAVTYHLDVPTATQTGHPGSRATSYLSHGDLVGAGSLSDAKRVDHWYQVSAIDVPHRTRADLLSSLAIRSPMDTERLRTEMIVGRTFSPGDYKIPVTPDMSAFLIRE